MKKCLALLLCLILLCAALPASALTDGELQQKLDAAFEADALKLVETTLPICHPAIDDLELSEGLLEYLKQHTDSEDPAAALKDCALTSSVPRAIRTIAADDQTVRNHRAVKHLEDAG